MLTDEQIDSADMQSLSWMAPRGKDSVREFARAVESAATAPLLAEIERFAPYLKDGETPIERLERECKDNAALLGLLAKDRARIKELEAQASNAQAEPLVLERLSAEEVRKAIIDEGMMFTAPDYRVAAAIQSAIAAKNGAKLK